MNMPEAKTVTFDPDLMKRPYPDKPHGISGWLLLLVIGLGLSGVVVMQQAIEEIGRIDAKTPALVGNPIWTKIKLVTYGTAGLKALLALCSLALLATNLKRETPRWVMLMILAAGVVPPVVQYVGYKTVNPASPPGVSDEILTSFIAGVLYFLIWGGYLVLSKRVRNTYIH